MHPALNVLEVNKTSTRFLLGQNFIIYVPNSASLSKVETFSPLEHIKYLHTCYRGV